MSNLKVDYFAINFRQLVHELGLTQKEVSEKLGITPAATCQLLNGDRLPSAETTVKIINTFHVKFERLFR